MKNPLKRNKPLTVAERIRKDELRVSGWLSQVVSFRPRLERLDKLYPDTINYVDVAISKYITLRNGLEIPEEFLCSCKLLGLKVNEVERKSSYSDKKGQGFYYGISFHDIDEDNCEDD
mgnify:CR=1 FL=1|jgi:hypothetical protein